MLLYHNNNLFLKMTEHTQQTFFPLSLQLDGVIFNIFISKLFDLT